MKGRSAVEKLNSLLDSSPPEQGPPIAKPEGYPDDWTFYGGKGKRGAPVQGGDVDTPASQETRSDKDERAAARDGWAKHAEALADWTLARLVVRKDVYGGYGADGRTFTSHNPVTRELLIRHFRGEHTIGLHSTSPDNRCLAFAADIDAHDDQAVMDVNWRCAEVAADVLREFELIPYIFDSNGKGGYHVRAFFKKPVPASVAEWLGAQVNARLEAEGLPRIEVFPKRGDLTIDTPYGNWLRVAGGRHHKRDHWSGIWCSVAEEWIEGENAALRLIRIAGDTTDSLLAAHQKAEAEKASQRPAATRNGYHGPSDQPDEAKVRAALNHIPNRDVGYDSWLGIGIALNDWDPGRGLDIWLDWSRQSSKFDESETRRKYASFSPGGGITIASLFRKAMDAGWRPAGDAPRASVGGSKPASNGTGHHDAEERPHESPDDPHRLARIYIDRKCRHDGVATLVYHRGEFHRWEKACYRATADHELGAGITATVKDEYDRINRIEVIAWEARGKLDGRGKPCDRPAARKVTKPLVGNVDQALRGMALLSGRVDPPAWLISDPPFPAEDVLPTTNALVHLPSYVQDRPGASWPPTPGYFGTYALDYAFDPGARDPDAWFDFLLSVWPGDPESINALQEWMGYLLTPDTSQQKIGVFIGPTRSGRGTISRVIRGLIGAANVASPTLSGLATHFGAACLVGKPLAIIGDARLSGRADWAIALERLLMISGEDAIEIDRKNRPSWEGKLPTRIMLISNELPRFPDQSGALAGRFLLFRFTESFLGREDRSLDAKLQAELPGILLWAIEGWKRLRERGHFLQPPSGQDLIEQMRDLSSPVGAFVRERCEVGPGFRERVGDVFSAWKDWCASRNREPGEEGTLGRNLRTVLPHVTTKPAREGGSYVRYFEGLGIKSDAS